VPPNTLKLDEDPSGMQEKENEAMDTSTHIRAEPHSQ
jgi:hypothetical protein